MLDKTKAMLEHGLDPSVVSKIKKGSFEVSYIEGWYVIETANQIFGHDGWESRIKSLTWEKTDKGFAAVAQMAIKVDFIDGDVVKEDVGVGETSAKQGLELCIKDAVTDGLKRAFRQFGSRFGNSLYDKHNPIHGGKEDSHVKRYGEDDAGNVLQMLEHDLGPVSTIKEWKGVVSKYGAETRLLPEEWKKRANALAMKHKPLKEKE